MDVIIASLDIFRYTANMKNRRIIGHYLPLINSYISMKSILVTPDSKKHHSDVV